MSDIELYALYRVQGGSEMEMTRDTSIDALNESCAYMNAHAPDGVVYEVREVQMSTKPFKARDRTWIEESNG